MIGLRTRLDLGRPHHRAYVRHELRTIRDILADAYTDSPADSSRAPSASAGAAVLAVRRFFLRVVGR